MKKNLSIILPCLNEESSIELCIRDIDKISKENNINTEIIVVDNGSKDRSIEILENIKKEIKNLFIIKEEKQGYGSAYLKGFLAARNEYIYMADSDYTYDFSEIPNFIRKLDEGNDLVIGNRFHKKIEKGIMPITHKYIGNPILSFITRLFFNIKIKDIHCGARAIKKSSFKKLNLQTAGMEFASEMIIKASKKKLKIIDIPINYRKRIGKSKLKTYGDGWRHLRFILIYSPLVLFLLPGIFLMLIGSILMFIFYFTKPEFLGINLFFHPMFLFSTMIITGYQLILFAMFSKIYAINHLEDRDPVFEKLFKIFTIEVAGLIGIIILISGSIIYGLILYRWIKTGFGSLDEIKNSIVALTTVVIGIQTFFSSFMLSILGIKEKK